jgi:alanine racemase
VKGLLDPSCRLLAVVKADAYGFGAVEAARVAVEAGAAMLGVTLVEEALELRAHGISTPILVFAPPLPQEVGAVVAAELTPTVTDPATARALAREVRNLGKRIRVHVKVDSGLGRLGVRPENLRPLLRELALLPELEVEGLYSHLDPHPRRAREQVRAFVRAREVAVEEGWQIPLYHLCSSSGVLRYPHLHLDMVRVGTLLYGQWPAGVPRRLDLRDPWQLRARLLQVKEVPPGSRVGYGRGGVLRRRARLGVVALGWADGLGMMPERAPENWWELAVQVGRLLLARGGGYRGNVGAELDGRPLRLVGRPSMQLSVFDLTAAEGALAGQEVRISGLRRTAAAWRLPRLYLCGGRAYRLRTATGWVEIGEEER